MMQEIVCWPPQNNKNLAAKTLYGDTFGGNKRMRATAILLSKCWNTSQRVYKRFLYHSGRNEYTRVSLNAESGYGRLNFPHFQNFSQNNVPFTKTWSLITLHTWLLFMHVMAMLFCIRPKRPIVYSRRYGQSGTLLSKYDVYKCWQHVYGGVLKPHHSVWEPNKGPYIHIEPYEGDFPRPVVFLPQMTTYHDVLNYWGQVMAEIKTSIS